VSKFLIRIGSSSWLALRHASKILTLGYRSQSRGLDYFQGHGLNSVAWKPYHPGRAIGQVNNPGARDRTPVIHSDYDGPTIPLVRHLYQSAQRKLPMGSRELKHIVRFTAGGCFTVERLTVPGSCSDLVGFRGSRVAMARGRRLNRIFGTVSFLGSNDLNFRVRCAGGIRRLCRQQSGCPYKRNQDVG
jgi:hypothetical protein